MYVCIYIYIYIYIYIWQALIALFRVATRDAWSETMFAYSLRIPDTFRKQGVEDAKRALFNYTQASSDSERMESLRYLYPSCSRSLVHTILMAMTFM
jgi:hypothetical protein